MWKLLIQLTRPIDSSILALWGMIGVYALAGWGLRWRIRRTSTGLGKSPGTQMAPSPGSTSS